MTFDESQTRSNLMRAFAGECMARARYDIAAQAMDAAQLYALGRLFRFTANQEREHAELFYARLAQAAGQLPLSSDYPVRPQSGAPALLQDAAQSEFQESGIYPRFAAMAAQEGFPDIARLFEDVARIEQTHGGRFARYAEWLEGGCLFHEDGGTTWVCLNCGHVVEGPDAPQRCPVCQHAQGYFVRAGGIL